MNIELSIENLGVTPEEEHYIKESLKGITIHPDEVLEIKESGQFNSQGEIIYKIVLTLDGNIERFVCFI